MSDDLCPHQEREGDVLVSVAMARDVTERVERERSAVRLTRTCSRIAERSC